MSLRIGSDLDDVINQFLDPYFKRFGVPKNDLEITKNVHRVLFYDKDFWMNLPLLHVPDFQPTLYCTKRIHNKNWSKEYLKKHNLPIAPIYQIYCQSSPKSAKIKGKVDVFIDDSISNFIEMNLNGVPCLLMDGKHNEQWGPIGRIFSLELNEIENAYELFMSTMYPHFKVLANDFLKRH